MSFIKRLKAACWSKTFDLSRAAIHSPIGFVIIESYQIHWILPPTIAVLFYWYEHSEDHHLKDGAWKDICGALLAAVGTVLYLLIRRWL